MKLQPEDFGNSCSCSGSSNNETSRRRIRRVAIAVAVAVWLTLSCGSLEQDKCGAGIMAIVVVMMAVMAFKVMRTHPVYISFW